MAISVPRYHKLLQWKNQIPTLSARILKITYPRPGMWIVSFSGGSSVFGGGYTVTSEGAWGMKGL